MWVSSAFFELVGNNYVQYIVAENSDTSSQYYCVYFVPNDIQYPMQQDLVMAIAY